MNLKMTEAFILSAIIAMLVAMCVDAQKGGQIRRLKAEIERLEKQK